MKIRFMIVLAITLLTGCVQIESIAIEDEPRGEYKELPRRCESLRVYRYGAEVPDHTKLAVLSTTRNRIFTTRKTMLNRMCKEANGLGANALIVQENTELDVWQELGSMLSTAMAVSFLLDDAPLLALLYLPGTTPAIRNDTAVAINLTADVHQSAMEGTQ